MCSERAADVCLPASACADHLSVLGRMLEASVLVSLGARPCGPGAGANTGQNICSSFRVERILLSKPRDLLSADYISLRDEISTLPERSQDPSSKERACVRKKWDGSEPVSPLVNETTIDCRFRLFGRDGLRAVRRIILSLGPFQEKNGTARRPYLP